jgi:hypothetical protein
MAWPRMTPDLQRRPATYQNRPPLDKTRAIRKDLSDRYQQIMSPFADYFEYGLQKFTLGSIMDNENISVNQLGCNADWV